MKKHVFIISAVILLGFSAGISAAAGLSDTGQTKCYNNTGEISCPADESEAFYGQDAQAQYTFIPQSFTKLNADGSIWVPSDPPVPHAMVRDNVTGLIWEVKTDENKSGTYNWPGAKDYCDNLIIGEYSDWRLPTVKEYQSIAHYGAYNPVINTEYFPNTAIATTSLISPYWSSEYKDTSNSWYFDFKQGKAYYQTINKLFYVRAVRCSESISVPSLIQNPDGTVTDIKTGLTWYVPQTQPNPLPNWSAALVYCNDLKTETDEDWRMPNIKELASIVNLNKSSPAADTEFFPNILSAPFWSSSTNNGFPDRAYTVVFTVGTVDIKEKSNIYQTANVIAVRGGGYGSFAAKADLNRDSRVDLTDAIMALQICGGMEPAIDVTFGMENICIDGELKIGMPEAIYILQEVAGLYRCL